MRFADYTDSEEEADENNKSNIKEKAPLHPSDGYQTHDPEKIEVSV